MHNILDKWNECGNLNLIVCLHFLFYAFCLLINNYNPSILISKTVCCAIQNVSKIELFKLIVLFSVFCRFKNVDKYSPSTLEIGVSLNFAGQCFCVPSPLPQINHGHFA